MAIEAFSPQQEEVRNKQLSDVLIRPLLKAKENKVKPANQQSQGLQALRLLHIWDQFEVYQGQLYRQFEKPEETVTLQLILPASMREEVLRDWHEGADGGRLGTDKLFGLVQERFYWPEYHNDVSEWVKKCGVCNAKVSSTMEPSSIAECAIWISQAACSSGHTQALTRI